MATRTKKQRAESDSEPCGFRITPDGEVQMLTRAETDGIIRRALRQAMINAGFRIRPSAPTLH